MTDKYVLDGHTPVLCHDLLQWAQCFGGEDARRVADTTIGEARVSTVFLGLDHSFGYGPPLLFETMVFGGPLDQEQERCTTWEQAEEMHKAMCARVIEQASTLSPAPCAAPAVPRS